ncbi:putative mfs transporter [Phaeomoniella chlamydospora]|uniref:Putative mfs transporter n=1 Tax=Phaeomoniella chlamydospora TaxID=158046 RepID=A0A0G2E245_PHACM|nr:putative mfs transporter [Phaeomoniella chlamydospora]
METSESSAEVEKEKGRVSGTDDTYLTSEKDPTSPVQPYLSRRSGGHESTEQPENDEAENHRPTGLKLYILLAGLCFSALLMSLNGSMVSTAIPKITSHFNSLEDIGWYGSAYLIPLCTLQPLIGKIYTYFPIKNTYVTFSGIFFVASAISGSATSSKVLIVARAVQGIGGAGIINGALTTISAVVPVDKKPLYTGLCMGLAGIGSVIGPLIGGAVTEKISWRWCFYINLPPGGIVLCILFILTIPEQMKKEPMGGMMSLAYYLPIWFQVVKDASPLMSGVMILPTAISQSVGAAVSGKFGMMTTYVISTGAGAWIGYQILIGLGRGPVLQMPIIAIQNLLPAKDIAIATSNVFFFQFLGSAIFVALGETIFTNTLRSSLRKDAPNVDAQSVIDAGASSVRSVVPESELHNVLRAYNHTLIMTFYLTVGGSCVAFMTSFGMGFQKIKKKDNSEKPEKEAA